MAVQVKALATQTLTIQAPLAKPTLEGKNKLQKLSSDLFRHADRAHTLRLCKGSQQSPFLVVNY